MSIAASASVKNERLKLETRTAGNIDKEVSPLKRFDSFSSYRSFNGFGAKTQGGGEGEEGGDNGEYPAMSPSTETPHDDSNVKNMPPRAPKSSSKEKRKKHRKSAKENVSSAATGNKNFSSDTEITLDSQQNNRQTSKNDEEEFIESLKRLHRRRRQTSEETPPSQTAPLQTHQSERRNSSSIQTRNNAFEYFKAESKDGSRAGSGDDENNNDQEVKVDIDRPNYHQQQQQQRNINGDNSLVSEQFFRPVQEGNTLEFALTPAPQGNIVNCIVTSRKGILSNEYFFYLENFNGEAFLIMRAHRKASARSYFLIDIFNYNGGGDGGGGEKNKPSETNAARIVSNMSRNKFKLELFNTNLVSPELLVVSYKTNVGEPRKILADAKLCSGKETFLAQDKVTYILKNRNPYFDFKRKKFVLNYNGRAHKSSKNNFQIVDESSPDDVLMQLGKVETSYYNCDYGFPMCGLQAFGLALSSLCR
jgi:tubby and related proteins